jgi:hypothetical protein
MTPHCDAQERRMTMAQSSDFISFSEAEWLPSLISQPPRPNLLVVCNSVGLEAVVTQLMRRCTGLLQSCRLPGALHLPAHKIDALVIRDAAAMTLAQQIKLFDWMTRAGLGAQVISVTSRPLLPLVEDGRFLEGLFYRLNVVSIAATHRTGSVNGGVQNFRTGTQPSTGRWYGSGAGSGSREGRMLEGDILITAVGEHYAIGRLKADRDTQQHLGWQLDRTEAVKQACALAGANHRVFLCVGTSAYRPVDCAEASK